MTPTGSVSYLSPFTISVPNLRSYSTITIQYKTCNSEFSTQHAHSKSEAVSLWKVNKGSSEYLKPFIFYLNNPISFT